MMTQLQVHILHGVPASAGIAIGQAVVIDTKKIERYPKLRVSEDRVEDELKRFDDATILSQKQITEAIRTLESHNVIKEHSLILETHLLMLKDPALIDRVKELISEDYIMQNGP
jgi:phosphoenolpyruvate-protein phosphotransferase (PTS system enzyme I)